MKKIPLYMGAGLFNLASRKRNVELASDLQELSSEYEIVLPQREAVHFLRSREFNLPELAEHCFRQASEGESVFIGCLDGADADSGQAVEFGAKIASDPERKAVLYRTDFRTALDQELGINGMFRLHRAELVYLPCFAVEVADLQIYRKELALKVHAAIGRVLARVAEERLEVTVGDIVIPNRECPWPAKRKSRAYKVLEMDETEVAAVAVRAHGNDLGLYTPGRCLCFPKAFLTKSNFYLYPPGSNIYGTT